MTGSSDRPIRFTQQIAPGISLAFLRHPVSIEPADGTVAIVTGDNWQTAGIFRDGAWRRKGGSPFAQPVRFWTIPVAPDRG